MIFFAHIGHDHETPAAAPTPPEPATVTPKPEVTTATTTAAPQPLAHNTPSPDILTGGGLLLGLVMFWVLATYVFKVKLTTRLSITMVAFLVVGMAGYQSAPIASIVALTVGIAMALGMVLVQLGTKTSSNPKA